MPTLGEACQQLRVGRVTLAKWIKRLGIETTRHEFDWRYEVIAPEDVDRIAEARRKLPVTTKQPVIYTSDELAFGRRSTASGSDAIPTPRVAPLAPTPRPRQPQRRAVIEASLPDGLVSLTEAADMHGVLRYMTTFRRWRDEYDKLDCDPRTFSGERGQFPVVRPLTRKGLAQFYQLASPRSDFVRCSACPHEDEP